MRRLWLILGSIAGCGLLAAAGTVPVAAQVAVTGTTSLKGSVCPAASTCVAVGGDTLDHGAVVSIDVTHPSSPVPGTPASIPSVFGLQGFACPPSQTTCYAAGQSISPSEGAIVPIDITNPANPLPGSPIQVSQTAVLSDIACPTSTTCVTVGTSPSNQGEVVPMTGGVPGTPLTNTNTSFRGVGCPSASLCLAVGVDDAVSQGIVVPVDLSTSPATLKPPVDVSGTNDFQAVACPTATQCIAVGYFFNGATATAAVVVLSLSGTSVTPSTPQLVSSTNELSSVRCTSASACVASGLQTAPSREGLMVPVIQGKAKKAVPMAGTSWLFGVACSGTSYCEGFGVNTSNVGVVDYLAPAVKTLTTLKSSLNPATHGQPVTYSAMVKPKGDGGTVAFTDNGSAIPGCTAVKLINGTGRCKVTYTAAGSHSIVATYSGDAIFAGSVSATLTEAIT